MKKALLLVSVLSLVGVGEFSLAAKQEQATKKSKVAKKEVVAKKAATKKAAATTVATTTTVTTTTTTAAPAKTPVAQPALSGATTVTAAPQTAKPFKPGFALTWISYNALNMKAFSNDNPSDREAYAWEQPTVKYKLTETLNIGVMPQFLHTWFGNPNREQDLPVQPGQLKQPYALYMGNIALKLTSKKIAMLPGGIKLDGELRYDAPTSELSQRNGEYGQLWGTVGLARSFGKLDLKFTYIARYYMQQFNTSSLIGKDGKNMVNNSYRQYAFLDTGFNFTDKLSTTLELGSKITYKYADPDTGRLDFADMKRIAILDVSYAFSKAFTFSAGISEDTGALNDGKLPWDTSNTAEGGEVYLAGTFNI